MAVPGIAGIGQVKLPVSDLEASARWYANLLDMRLIMEFAEQGEMRGVVLEEPGSGLRIALRDRSYCAGQPTLTGFDVFSVRMAGVEAVEEFAHRCERSGIQTGGVHHFPGGAFLDVPDPDGTVVRIHYPGPRPPFMGFDSEGTETRMYNSPRLAGLPTLADDRSSQP